MKIAVLSDIHEHLDNLEKVLGQIKGKAEELIFCGDMISGFTTGVLAKADLPTYVCLGNNDEDHIAMYKKGNDKFTWIQLSLEFGQVTLGGKKIAYCHYPKLAELLAKSGDYDAVFFGHTHQIVNKKVGKTLLLNPGAVCGIDFSDKNYGTASYAIYDTASNSAEIIKL